MATNSATNPSVPADTVSSTSSVSTSSTLNQALCQKNMQWWYFGPVVLAVMMFLLMGTLFERRIEGVWRHILERRPIPSTTTESTETTLDNSPHIVRTPSQRTLGSYKAGTTTTGDGENKLETKSCIFPKKHFMLEEPLI